MSDVNEPDDLAPEPPENLELSDELLGLSDDDLLGMTFEDLSAKAGVTAAPASTEPTPPTPTEPAPGDEDEDDDADAAPTPSPVPGDDAGEGGAAAKAPADGPAADAKPDVKPVEEAKNTDPLPDLKPEDQLAKFYAPFKANGKEMQVNNVDEAISLMQMGANYTKKMASLKPHLKMIKLLENNGLLDENKLSFLIDLDKKSPQAISKLLKDSGIDPLDVDVDKVGEYKPNTYTVDDRELALDAVLDDIQGTPTYGKTIDLVSNKWDAPSKQVIADNPQLLKVLNDHMASGHYDMISNEVDRERAFGRLAGLSDIEAYRAVGDALAQAGKFAQLASAPAQAPVKKVVPTKPAPDDAALKDKKRAASPTQAAPAKKSGDLDFNPLNLSDAEFAKFAASKFQ